MKSLIELPWLGLCAVLLVLLIGFGIAHAEELQVESSEQLKQMAAQYERDGAKAEAADSYERLLALDPDVQRVVAPRLVALYSELGQRDPALKWAKEFAVQTPDPAAYLAGVYAELGDYSDAVAMLEAEVAQATDTHRVVVLWWQVADVHIRSGDTARAREALQHAAERATGTADAAAAERRVAKIENLETTAKSQQSNSPPTDAHGVDQ